MSQELREDNRRLLKELAKAKTEISYLKYKVGLLQAENGKLKEEVETDNEYIEHLQDNQSGRNNY